MDYPKIEPDNPAVKMATKLKKLTMHQLVRRQHQFARRASTAYHIAEKSSKASPFLPNVLKQFAINKAYLGQATAEITARLLVCKGKLKRESI